ncbi:hypothetical protein DIPPA_34996 [Diplonema papillatum]|nr:hypothetical protein DIPPA_34996 [Diplonema papillatum]
MQWAGVLARRSVSTRCMQYTEPWVWQPHTDRDGYFEELARRPLKDAVTGTHVHVVAASEFSEDSAKDVVEYLAECRNGPRGRKLHVCLNFHDSRLLPVLAQCHTGDPAAREKNAALASGMGYPPDLLAQSLLNHQARGLFPHQATTAAAKACQSLGIPVSYLGLPPALPYEKLRYVHSSATDLLASFEKASQTDHDAQKTALDTLVHAMPSQCGLHADPAAHVVPRDLAAMLQNRPRPAIVERCLTSIDFPTLFFRVVHPTAHFVRQVKKAIWDLPYNDGQVIVVLDAPVAALFYKMYKDEGITDDDLSAVSYNFNPTANRARRRAVEAEKEVLEPAVQRVEAGGLASEREVAALDACDGNDAGAPLDQKQAEFELQLVLFFYLSKLRPDHRGVYNAVANVFLMHGLLDDALRYLISLITLRIPGTTELVINILDELITSSHLTPDHPLVQDVVRLIETTESTPNPRETPLLLPLPATQTSPGDATNRMLLHDSEGRVSAVQYEDLPEVREYHAGDLSEQKSRVVGNALMEMKEKELARHTPTEAKQDQMLKRRSAVLKTKFNQPALHPLSAEYRERPNGALASQGVIHALQRYRPNENFPVPPEQKIEVEEHAHAAHQALARKYDVPPVDKLLREAKRIRTESPPRTGFFKALLTSKKEDKAMLRSVEFSEREDRRWEKADRAFPFLNQ